MAGGGPQIDILIPVHNRPKLLRKCVESLFEQTHSNFRIVIWDDGSTLEYDLPDDPRIEMHRDPENRGVAHARNRLLELVEAPYACWQDSDDLADPTRLAKCLEVIEDTGADVVFSYMLQIRRKARGVAKIDPSRYTTEGVRGIHKNLAFATAFFRREIARFQFEVDPRTGGEVVPWIAALIRGGCSFGLVPEPLYVYRMHSGRFSWRKD